MADIIQWRRDASSNWSTANPVLAQGEVGYETDANRFKVGNGVSSYNALPYAYAAPAVISAGTNSANSGTVVFGSSAGNVTFGMDTAGYVTASAAGNVTMNLTGNTAGSSQVTANPMYLQGGNNVTLSGTSNTIIISGPDLTGYQQVSNTSAITSNAAGTGVTTAGTNASLSATLNSNGLNLAVSVNPGGGAGFSGGVSTGGNIAGDTGTVSNQIVFVGGNNVTLSQATGAGGATVTISGANAGGAQTGISGLSAGTTQMTSGTAVFGDANGISFGVNGNTVTASYTVPNVPAQTQQPMYFSASGTNTSANTLQFGNSNGVSFSLSNGSVIATVKTDYQSAGAYLTTARASNDGVGLNAAATNVTWTVNSGGISLDAGAYLTTAQPVGAYLTTAMASNAGSNFIGTNTALTGNGVLMTANSSGISLNVPAFLTTAAQSDHSHGMVTTTTNGSLVTVQGNSGGYTLAVPPFVTAAGAGDGNNVLGINGNATSASTTYILSNANDLSFGWNAGTITASASFAGGAQSVAVSGSNGSFNFSTLSMGSSNGMHFYTTNGSIVGSYTVPTQTVDTNKAGTGFSSTTTAGTAVVGTLNTNGLSIGVPAFLTTAQPVGAYLTTAAQSSASNVSAVYAGTASNGGTATLSGGVSFSNANGVSFYTSAGNAVVATVKTDYLTTAMASNAGSNFVGLNSALTGNGVSMTANSSGISLNVPAFLTTAMASNAGSNFVGLNSAVTGASLTVNSSGISINVPAAAPSPVYVEAGTTNGSLATISFNNANGVSFGLNGSTITASAAGGGGAAIGVSSGGNTSNTTGTYSSGSYVLAGGNNITLSQVSGTGGATVTISGAAGGGVGASNIGVTSGNTGVVSGQVAFVGSNGGWVSQSTNGNSATVIIAPAPMNNYPYFPVALSSSSMVSGTSGAGSTSAAFYINPLILDRDMNGAEIEMVVSQGAASAGTGSCTVGYHMGFYTLNNNTAMSLVSSFSAAMRFSQNSATAQTVHTYWGSNSTNNSTQTSGNISAAFMSAGLRDIKLYDSSFTLPAGSYWVAHCYTMRSSSVNVGASFVTGMYAAGVTNHAYLGQSTLGPALAARWIGSFTSQVTGAAGNTLSMSMPVSVHTSAITQSASNAGRWLIPRMYI